MFESTWQRALVALAAVLLSVFGLGGCGSSALPSCGPQACGADESYLNYIDDSGSTQAARESLLRLQREILTQRASTIASVRVTALDGAASARSTCPEPLPADLRGEGVSSWERDKDQTEKVARVGTETGAYLRCRADTGTVDGSDLLAILTATEADRVIALTDGLIRSSSITLGPRTLRDPDAVEAAVDAVTAGPGQQDDLSGTSFEFYGVGVDQLDDAQIAALEKVWRAAIESRGGRLVVFSTALTAGGAS